jgi:hypothetical protein
MGAEDLLKDGLTDLLIENSTMKRLLREGFPNLDAILKDAKMDLEKRQRLKKEVVAPMMQALKDEVDLRQKMQRIAESSEGENQA